MKSLVSAAAVTAIAGSAFGLGETLDRSNAIILTVDTPGVQFTRTAIGTPSPTPVAVPLTTTYDSLAGIGFVASAPATGNLGVEDYGTTDSSSGPPNGTPVTQFETRGLHEFGFAGGQDNGSQGAAVSGVIFFDFFFNDFSFANSFGVALPTAGAYFWTITIGNPAALQIPTEGFSSMFANNNPNIGPVTSGRWFLSDVGANPLIGHNDLAIDNGTFDFGTTTTPDVRNIGHNFSIVVPTPGAAAIMGLAGVAGLRRRRR